MYIIKMSNSYESGKIMEILNSGILVINETLKDINKNIHEVDESLQMILRFLQEKERERAYEY